MQCQLRQTMLYLAVILFISVPWSPDAGAQLEFSPPGILNTDALTDDQSNIDLGAQIATDGKGNWVVVWSSPRMVGGNPDTFALRPVFARSTNNGQTWTDPQLLSTTGTILWETDQPEIELTTDGIGNWVVAWASMDSLGESIGFDRDILFSRSTNNGETWSDSAPLNTNADTDSGQDWEPDLAADGEGNWVAAWHSDDTLGDLMLGGDADILFARSSDGGMTWSDPAPLNTDAATDPLPPVPKGDWSVAVDTDRQGNWVAVWGFLAASTGGILSASSSDQGQTWSDPAPVISESSLFVFVPEVATDGNGHWIATYNNIQGGDHEIMISRCVDNSLNWTQPVTLNTTAPTDVGDDSWCKTVTDGQGNWIAFWSNTFGNIGGPDWDILAALSTDHGETWTDPVFLNTNADSDTQTDDGADMATDQRGTWIAVWSSADENAIPDIGTDRDILSAKATIRDGTPLLGDLNGDGRLDGEDLLLFQKNWHRGK